MRSNEGESYSMNYFELLGITPLLRITFTLEEIILFIGTGNHIRNILYYLPQ